MSLVDDKKNIFTTIGAYTSMQEQPNLPNNTNIFPSINNKKDVVSFLLDLLKVVVGSNALKDLTGKLFTDFIGNVEPQLKTALKKQTTQYNAGDSLPQYFKTNGVSVSAKNIDVYGKLKTNPNSDSGSLLYDNSSPNFDSVAYQAISNDGTDIPYKNLLIKYNSNTDSFVFKSNPANTSSSATIGEWFGNFIDSTTIINKKEFMSTVMNSIYGSITATQNKTVEQVFNELKINKQLEQLNNDEQNSFEISESDYDELQQQAKGLVDGVVYYDMGCGLISASLSLDDLTTLINDISDSTDSFAVGNAIDSTIDSSANNQDVTNENRESIKDGFFQRLIKAISLALGQFMTTSPQARALLAIMSAFQNNGNPKTDDPVTDLKEFRIFIKCILREAAKMINEFIFNLITSVLISLLTPIIKKIIKEKINQYVGIIKSLIT